MDYLLEILHIVCACILATLAKGNHISIGPGAYSSNKTLAGGPRNVLVLGSCEFMHNGTVINVNFYVATPDWLYLQIWRPLYDEDNTMQVIYQKLVIPDVTEDILQVWLADEDVRVQVGDMVGFTKLNNTFPIPYIFKPQMSSDLWYHALDGFEDMVATGQYLGFEELGFPYHFSVTVTFRPDIPNVYETLREDDMNISRPLVSDIDSKLEGNVLSGTDTWLGDKRERWPYNPVTKTLRKFPDARAENLVAKKPPVNADQDPLHRTSIESMKVFSGPKDLGNRDLIYKGSQSKGTDLNAVPPLSESSAASQDPNNGKPGFDIDDTTHSKIAFDGLSAQPNEYLLQENYTGSKQTNPDSPAESVDSHSLPAPSTPMTNLVTDELRTSAEHGVNTEGIIGDTRDDIRAEGAITEAPLSSVHTTKPGFIPSSSSNMFAPLAKTFTTNDDAPSTSLPINDGIEQILPSALEGDNVTSTASDKPSNFNQNNAQSSSDKKISTNNIKNIPAH